MVSPSDLLGKLGKLDLKKCKSGTYVVSSCILMNFFTLFLYNQLLPTNYTCTDGHKVQFKDFFENLCRLKTSENYIELLILYPIVLFGIYHMAVHYRNEEEFKGNEKKKRQTACRAEFVWGVFDVCFLVAAFSFLAYFTKSILDGTAVRYCIVKDPFLDGYIKFNCVQNNKYYMTEAVLAVKMELVAFFAIIGILSCKRCVKLNRNPDK